MVSQEFARFAKEFHSNQSFTFQCRSCAHADFVAVAAGAGRAGVADGSHRGGTRSMLSRMVCGAGRWLSTVASKIRCAGGHVLVSTHRLRTICWLVVVGCEGGQLPRAVSWIGDGVIG